MFSVGDKHGDSTISKIEPEEHRLYIWVQTPSDELLIKVERSFGLFDLLLFTPDKERSAFQKRVRAEAPEPDIEDPTQWTVLANMFSSYKKVYQEFWDFVPVKKEK